MIYAILSGILMLVGVVGAVLPFLPGPPLSFAGLLLYALATHFVKVSPVALIVFGILTALTLVLDIAAPALGARGYKATRSGILGSILGAIFGMFVAGPVGIIIGPFVGGFLGEYFAVYDPERAFWTAWGALVGFLFGTVVRFGVTVAIGVYFIYALFR